MSRKKTEEDKYLICVCGHPLSRHEVLGTPYARCRLWSPRGKCNCEMGAVPVLKVEGDSHDLRRFQRVARGSERPHALTGAVAKMVDSGVKFEWLKTACDKCGQDMQGDPQVRVLDEDGYMQRPGKPRTNGGTMSVDTGHHVMICKSCDNIDQTVTGYKEP